MKIGLIGDVHLSDRPPSIRTEKYSEQILGKLDFAMKHFKAENCDAVVQAGDMFHIKTPNRTSHKLVQATADVLTSSGLPVLVVPGNHDMQHDRLESLPSQPLGTLSKVKGIDLLLGWHTELPIYGIPFLGDWVKDLPKWMEGWRKINAEGRMSSLLVTHAPIFPPKQEVIYEYIDADDWAKNQEVGSCYYGHIHDPHGVYCSSDGAVGFCNNGAISRGSLHEATLKRKPAVTIWQPQDEGDEFTRVEVPHEPVGAVFRLRGREDVDARQARLDGFLASVGRTELPVFGVEEVLAHAEARGLKDRTLVEIRSLIEEAISK